MVGSFAAAGVIGGWRRRRCVWWFWCGCLFIVRFAGGINTSTASFYPAFEPMRRSSLLLVPFLDIGTGFHSFISFTRVDKGRKLLAGFGRPTEGLAGRRAPSRARGALTDSVRSSVKADCRARHGLLRCALSPSSPGALTLQFVLSHFRAVHPPLI